MPFDNSPASKSVHRQAFAHYLRTGQRLTNEEWASRTERKFNPYHDELGRFTSPPGVTVSWGKYAGTRENARRVPRTRTKGEQAAAAVDRATRSDRQSQPQSANGFQSDFVRNAVAPQTSDAVWIADLEHRRTYLDELRRRAGPNPDPSVQADLDDFQRRLDANAERLRARLRIADQEAVEILRAGLTPANTAAGAINIALGKRHLRDALAVAGAVPLAGTVGKLAKLAQAARAERIAAGAADDLIQLGGAYRDIRGMRGYEAHHVPGNAVSRHSRGDGPAVAMLKEDHRKILTSRGGKTAVAFRKRQSEHIAQGDFAAAMQMDIDKIRDLFGGKYDDAIEKALSYGRSMGFIR